MSRESKTSVKNKKSSSKSPSKSDPSTPSAPKKKSKDGQPDPGQSTAPGTPPRESLLEGVTPLDETPKPATPPKPPSTTTTTTPKPTASETDGKNDGPLVVALPPEEEDKHPKSDKKENKTENKKDKSMQRGSAKPRGGHQGSKPQRGEMKFGTRPSTVSEDGETHSLDDGEDHFDPSTFKRMSAVYFHKYNDLSRSARGVGYTPDQAVPKYGPGVNDEAETIYGPCRLLTDFQYSTWTETVVPLRNHNVVQGFNEMILFLIKLAANPDGPVNHEEAFMATSFLANIRNDLGEHPPNVLALLEYIDYKTHDDGTERAQPHIEVLTPCKAAERY